VLNLAEVPYIDSAGLGKIVRTYTIVTRHNGSLKLMNLTQRITDLLAITKLLTVFRMFNGDEGAEGADVGSRLRPRQPSDQQAISLPLPSTDSESE
jgi:anti-anti-sigma regulatory factor